MEEKLQRGKEGAEMTDPGQIPQCQIVGLSHMQCSGLSNRAKPEAAKGQARLAGKLPRDPKTVLPVTEKYASTQTFSSDCPDAVAVV